MNDFFKQKELEIKCSSLRKNILDKNNKFRKDKDEFDSTLLFKIKNYEKEVYNNELLIKFLFIICSSYNFSQFTKLLFSHEHLSIS